MLESGFTAIIAHRGASARAPENTVAAYRAARVDGADAVELDVRTTRDGFLVIHHDAEVPGFGPIIDRDFSDLRHQEPQVPTLEEAMAACAGMWVNVEVKNAPADPDFDAGRSRAVDSALQLAAAGLEERVLVSSFDWESVDVVRATCPRMATGLLVSPLADPGTAMEAARDGGHLGVHLHVSAVESVSVETLVAAADAAGRRLVVWTVNNPLQMEELQEAGIAGIITDDPSLAVDTLRSD